MEVSPAPESSSIVTFAHSTLKPTMILSEIGLLTFNLKVANVVLECTTRFFFVMTFLYLAQALYISMFHPVFGHARSSYLFLKQLNNSSFINMQKYEYRIIFYTILQNYLDILFCIHWYLALCFYFLVQASLVTSPNGWFCLFPCFLVLFLSDSSCSLECSPDVQF